MLLKFDKHKKNITDFKVEKREGGDLLITINDPEIVHHISEVAAKVFNEYAMDIDPDLVYGIVRALDEAETEDTFENLKLFFAISGDKGMTGCMDVVKICSKTDKNTFKTFKERFLSTDIMDCYLADAWFDLIYGEEDELCRTLKQ